MRAGCHWAVETFNCICLILSIIFLCSKISHFRQASSNANERYPLQKSIWAIRCEQGATGRRKLYIRDSRNGLPARRGLILKLQMFLRNIFRDFSEAELFWSLNVLSHFPTLRFISGGHWWNTYDNTACIYSMEICVKMCRQYLWGCLNAIR